MILETPDADWLTFFQNRFRFCAHQLLAWGYQDARSFIGPDLEEEDITGHLVKAIQDRLNDLNTPPEYSERYEVHEEKPIHSPERTGKKRQRIDILAICTGKHPRPELWFEAKRLKTQVCTIGKYVGTGGMQCYIKCEYAKNYPMAAMIGYIQNSTPSYWYSELVRVFGTDKALNVTKKLSQCQVVPSLSNEWKSSHNRTDGTDIELYHIFLDCT